MRLWNDCSGGVFTTELLLISSMVVAGAVTGLASYNNAIQTELFDLATSVQQVNQSYGYFGVQAPSSQTAGSQFIDQRDQQVGSTAAACVTIGY